MPRQKNKSRVYKVLSRRYDGKHGIQCTDVWKYKRLYLSHTTFYICEINYFHLRPYDIIKLPWQHIIFQKNCFCQQMELSLFSHNIQKSCFGRIYHLRPFTSMTTMYLIIHDNKTTWMQYISKPRWSSPPHH